MNPKLNGLVEISYVYVIKGYKSYEQHAYVKTHEPFQTTTPKIMLFTHTCIVRNFSFHKEINAGFEINLNGKQG